MQRREYDRALDLLKRMVKRTGPDEKQLLALLANCMGVCYCELGKPQEDEKKRKENGAMSCAPTIHQINNSLTGSLAQGFWRKSCRNSEEMLTLFVESCKQTNVLLHKEKVQKFSGKFADIL